MLYSTTIDMQEGRAAEKQRRTELWARWAEANPDKAAEMAERLAVSMQNLPRRCAQHAGRMAPLTWEPSVSLGAIRVQTAVQGSQHACLTTLRQ